MNHTIYIKFKSKNNHGFLAVSGSLVDIENLKTEIMLLSLHQSTIELSWMISNTESTPGVLQFERVEFESWQDKPPASNEFIFEAKAIAEVEKAIKTTRVMPTMFCSEEDNDQRKKVNDIRFRSDAFGGVRIEIITAKPCSVAIHYEIHISESLPQQTTSWIKGKVEQLLENEPATNQENALKKLFDGELLLNPEICYSLINASQKKTPALTKAALN